MITTFTRAKDSIPLKLFWQKAHSFTVAFLFGDSTLLRETAQEREQYSFLLLILLGILKKVFPQVGRAQKNSFFLFMIFAWHSCEQ
ncbi:MAG: hypothetical protein AAB518_00815, partial [Patescibacteria group bacterium]